MIKIIQISLNHYCLNVYGGPVRFSKPISIHYKQLINICFSNIYVFIIFKRLNIGETKVIFLWSLPIWSSLKTSIR